jgi:hypothetical protein
MAGVVEKLVVCLSLDTERIRQTLQNKSIAYKDILNNRNLPYVIGLHLDFDAAGNPQQFHTPLFDQDTGTFSAYH